MRQTRRTCHSERSEESPDRQPLPISRSFAGAQDDIARDFWLLAPGSWLLTSLLSPLFNLQPFPAYHYSTSVNGVARPFPSESPSMETNDWNDAERRVERAQELF